MSSILIGTGVTSTQRFTNSAGTLTDPTTVSVTIREPDGTKTTYVYVTDPEVVKDSTGVYHISFVPDQIGSHGVYWLGTGTVPYSEELFFQVERSQVLV